MEISIWDVMLKDIDEYSAKSLIELREMYPPKKFSVPSCPKGTITYKWGKGAE